MLFTILCKKGPQITVTSFIERTSKFFFVVVVEQITLAFIEKLNECHQKKVMFFLFLNSHLPPAPTSIGDFYSQCVPFHSLSTPRTK